MESETENGLGIPADAVEFRASFETAYADNLREVIGLAFVLSGSRTGAEELAQEAFLAAFKRWERIAGYDDPIAWVRKVVANRAVSRFRRLRAEARALLRSDRREYVVPEGDPDADRLWNQVRSLPRRQAQVIALHYLDDRSISEVAEILDVSEPTVKTHLQRARRTLADRLKLEES